MPPNPTIELTGASMTDAMIATLQNAYEGLQVHRGEKTVVDLRELSPADQERIKLDLAFYSGNPHLPLENLCSRLDNYLPKNDSQQELLEYAGKLVEFPDLNKHRNPEIAYPPFASLTRSRAAGYSAISNTDFWLLLAGYRCRATGY